MPLFSKRSVTRHGGFADIILVLKLRHSRSTMGQRKLIYVLFTNVYTPSESFFKKSISFCNVMDGFVPQGDFPLELDGGFDSRTATPRTPAEVYSFLRSFIVNPESASLLAWLFDITDRSLSS